MTGAVMWQRYLFRGHKVIVVQKWTDPFGRRMVSIAPTAPDQEDVTAGMTEAEFLAEAHPADGAPSQN
jgi:hypothetical protein